MIRDNGYNEQHIQDRINKSPPEFQALGERLADMLVDDDWNNIEPYLMKALEVFDAPLAAAPQFEAVEVDDGMCERVADAFERILPQLHPPGRKLDENDYARFYIAAVRAVLGPTLGLAVMREPTAEECEEISRRWYRFEHSLGRDRGREIAAIVRAVMWPKGGES